MNGAIFTREGLEWRCHVIESGQRYEWRTQCGLTCHRYGRDYFAFDQGQPVGGRYSSLREAFDAACKSRQWRKAA